MGDDRSNPKAGSNTQKSLDLIQIEAVRDERNAVGNVNKTIVEATSSATVVETPALVAPGAPPTLKEAFPQRPVVAHEATRLESAEEIRKIVAEARATQAAAQIAAVPFRPLRRPPTAFLTICDDGIRDGETIRLRADRTLLGRDQGDVRIPHDCQMSATHAEIFREPAESSWRWVLADLGSANGVFVRISSVVLEHGAEFLVGSTRLRFDDAALNLPGAIQDTGPAMPAKTVGWQAFAPTDLKASFVVFRSQDAEGGPESRCFLDASELWIGRDPACLICLADDPLADSRHARVVRDAKGNWSLVDGKSQNGLWLRIKRHFIDSECEFQLGEQRFVVRIGRVT